MIYEPLANTPGPPAPPANSAPPVTTLASGPEATRAELREIADRLLVVRGRVFLLILLGQIPLFALGEWFFSPSAFAPLFGVKLIQAAVAGAALLALRGSDSWRYARLIALAVAAALCFTTAASNSLNHDLTLTPLLLTVLALGAATLFPWGMGPQAVAVATAGLAILWNVYAVTGTVAVAAGLPALGFGVAFLGSVYVAFEFERYRLDIERRNLSLRGYQDVVETTTDLIQCVAPDGSLTYVNRAWQQALGYSAEEARRLSVSDILHPSAAGHCVEVFGRLMAGENVGQLEATFLTKDGRTLMVEGNASCAVRDGQPIGCRAVFHDVTERKRAEEAVQASERRFRALIEGSTDAVALVAAEGTLLYVSPAGGRIFGRPAQADVGHMAFELMHPEDTPIMLDSLARLLQHPEESVNTQFRYSHSNGSWRWLEAIGQNLLAEPSVRAIVVHYRDITQRKHAEQQLAAQLAVTRILAGATTVRDALPKIVQALCGCLGCDLGAVWQVEPDNQLRCIEVSPMAPVEAGEFATQSRQLRCSPGIDLPGRVWASGAPACVPDIAADPRCSRAGAAAAAGLHGALAFPVLSEGAVSDVIELFGREIAQADDALLTTLVTIGGQIGMFIERRREEKARQQSEERYGELFENANDVIYTHDLAGNFTSLNRAAERVIGYTRQEALRLNLASLLTPESFELSARLIAGGIAGLDTRNTFEVDLIAKDGRQLRLEVRAQLVYERGTPVGVQGIARDITERKRTEAELQRAKEAAEAANRAKSEFLANMSHEIRTPMNGIIGMTELALDTALSPEQRDYLGMVKSSADALLLVINDVLDFSKIEAGKLQLDPTQFRLDHTLDHAMKALAVQADEKGLELLSHVLPGVPDGLVGDPGRLRQIIVNLVGNAIKFTQRGEVVVRVELQPARLAGCDAPVELHFSVRDTGIGIPAEKRQAIFQPFEQVDGSTARKYGGTGLGLTIASQLVDLMGGRMWVESEVDRGSTFHFTARFERCDESVNQLAAIEPEQLHGLRTLVVDDNATNRLILEEMLLNWHMEPRVVDNGRAALLAMGRAAAAGEPYRLVLLDAMMPEMDGFAVADQIRQRPELAGTTIMMLSSAGQAAASARCRQLGIAVYLTKPVRRSDLLDAILSAMANSTLVLDHPPERPPATPGASLRILLAEDNVVNQHLVARLMEKRGHQVAVARNGRQVLTLLDQGGGFDLILMDVQMPEMDGFEATAEIRCREIARDGNSQSPRVPIIALTAHAMKGDRERCLAAGMDDYVSKPIKAEELIAAVERLGLRSLQTCPPSAAGAFGGQVSPELVPA
ncbi:MAG: PAS domain S-box protein [Deltaproteobacteria bacterium]|nr:PAS domain S-box protein [Deltaproteobacteria bacterium]